MQVMKIGGGGGNFVKQAWSMQLYFLVSLECSSKEG